MYEYKARVVDVYDAYTITVDLDLRFDAWLCGVRVRLTGIDAPEVLGEERPDGLVSRDWLRAEMLGQDIVMKTTKDGTGKGKYGRWLAKLFRADGDVISINQELVTKGLAAPASY